MIRGTETTNYAYVNGVVRAREARLLTKAHFDRLISADSSSFKGALSDTDYAADDFPSNLNSEEERLQNFFDKYCQTEEVKKIIGYPKEIHNLKVRLKKGTEDILYPTPGTTVEDWPEIATEVTDWTIKKDPFILSTNLDKLLCKKIFEVANFAEFFYQYFQILFDLENIRSFFRARLFENKKEIFNQVYIPYGTIKQSLFLDNLETEQEFLARNFSNTAYPSIIDKGSRYLAERHSFLRLERLCEEERLKFLSLTRRMTFGIEPLFGYYHFKLNEIKNLRQVYSGKVNEIPVDDLKESIPDVF